MLLLTAGCGVIAPLGTESAPRGLSVEYRENPCGVETMVPRLSWKLGQGLEKEAVDVEQCAYRIVAASSLEKLARDRGDLWDTGRVAGDSSIGIVWNGARLATSQRVFWKVKTWCNRGRESAWSSPAEFTMGVVDPLDWKAKWIGPAAATRPDEDFGAAQWITAPVDAKGNVNLVYEFDWNGEGVVEMVHAGVSHQEIDVNGRKFHRWTAHVYDWRYPRFRDMSKWLRKGRNRIEVRIAADAAMTPGEPLDHIRFRGKGGKEFADVRAFIAKIIMPGGTTLVTGAKGWTSPDGEVKALGAMRDTAWGRHMNLRTETASPAFAKKFRISKPIASAVLHVTGVGFHETSLNGVKVGDKVLDPSPTAYDKRVLYSTYRLDEALRQGDNELRILVGHGWYDMRSISTWDFETAPWRDFPRCIAQLEIRYGDGTAETIMTDRTWRQVASPLGYDDNFEGEVLGARDPRGIDLEKTVVFAEEVPAPKGTLHAEAQPGAKVVRSFPAKSVKSCGDGVYVVDAGENVAGWLRFTIEGQKLGDVVSIRYDERVNADGTPTAESCNDGANDFRFSNTLDKAAAGSERRKIDAHFRYTASQRVCAKDAAFQCDRVVCSGPDAIVYEPRFIFHGFRYAVVKGLARAPRPQDFTVCVVHTAFPTIGSFKCSDPTFNQLMTMGDRAYRSNFADGVPTDCPHREKNGWTGDASIASELAQYLYENTAGYEKWLRDICDAQLPDGNLPGIVPSSGWGFKWGNGPGWDSALTVAAWNLWVCRGDRRILDEVYPAIVRYLRYTATKADADGCVSHGLGDWVSVDRKHMPNTAYTVSCYYFQAQRIAAEIAKLRGDAHAAAKFAAGADRTLRGINRKYYKGGGVYDNGGQTAQGMAVAFGLPEPSERKAVEAALVKSVEVANGHVDMGLYGTKHVFRALARIGRADLAWKMLVNPTRPSPVEWLQKGGTTLWEDWSDGSSRNHIMFGDFVGWAYQYLAGISPREAEGSTSAVTLPVAGGNAFRRVTIEPHPVPGLEWVRASVDGPSGEIVSSWKVANGQFSLEVTVPPGSRALVRMPDGSEREMGSGKRVFACRF